MVGVGRKMFVCGASGNPRTGNNLLVLACSPLGDEEVQAMAESLGTIGITRGSTGDTESGDGDGNGGVNINVGSSGVPNRFTLVQGGTLAAARNFLDIPVYFSAPLPTHAWPKGEMTWRRG